MTHWQYHNPVAVHFGAGVLDTLPTVLRGPQGEHRHLP